jgi:hypothetical protein
MKLLLTSAGSLVAQNVFDVLDYPSFSRRSLVQVIGTNSVPEAASNFLCDRCYLVRRRSTQNIPHACGRYSAASPDLIRAARDEDTRRRARRAGIRFAGRPADRTPTQ